MAKLAPIDQLKAIADDCREAADVYEKSPGLAGHGVNAGTIIDIYRRIAISIDAVSLAISSTQREQLSIHHRPSKQQGE